jgi:hypothetical protein
MHSAGLVRGLAVFFLCVCAPAQWLDRKTDGLPRLPDGKPDLEAPAPKAADGHPDLSGIWKPEDNRPCPPIGCNDMKIGQEFLDIGWSIGGLPYQPWAAALVKTRMARNGMDDPTSHCLPGGIIKTHTVPLYRKIVQTPGLVVILSERDAAYRQIFTDGRPLPIDPNPSWNGYSVGTWSGDVFAVVSKGFRDGIWLDRNGSPLTDAATITERFHRISVGKLEIEIGVNDPGAYTRPWTVKLNSFLAPDTEMLDYNCLENEKDTTHLVGK